MGQQQLLLIILGVIIVGIAIAVGLSLFSAQSIQSNKDKKRVNQMSYPQITGKYHEVVMTWRKPIIPIVVFSIAGMCRITPKGVFADPDSSQRFVARAL